MNEIIDCLKKILVQVDKWGDMLKSVYDPNADGVVVDSDKLEGSTKTQVQDHFLKAKVIARAYQSTEQTIPTGEYTKVNLQTENYDIGTSFANSRFTAKVAGYHLCIGNLRFKDIPADNAVGIHLAKNGTACAWRDNYTSIATSPVVGVSDMPYLAVDDYIELLAVHWTGSNKNLEALSKSTFLVVALWAIP